MLNKEPFVQIGRHVLELQAWTEQCPSLVVGFSTKQGGESKHSYEGLNVGLHVKDDPSAVLANRQLIAAELQFPLINWVIGEQVHQAEIAKVTKADKGRGAISHETAIRSVDGLYTMERDLLLASLYADCVPLFFYVPSKQMIGLAHAGWKGTVAEIGPKMIRTFIEKEKAELADIRVAIGPSISQQAYEVNRMVIEKVEVVLPKQLDKVAIKKAEDRYLLDLKEVNKQLLLAAGLKEEQILMSNYCTSSDKDLFYSYRRDEQTTGRMMSYIGFKSSN